MRTLPPGLAGALASGAARLCHVWLLTRRDGEVLGFTDHDRDLMVGGVLCRADTGLSPGAADQALGFAPGSASASGVLDSEAVNEAEILAGLYDGAALECRRLDWAEPSQAVSLWRGTVARISRQGRSFTAEIEGPLAALDRVAGRLFTRQCDAALGDERCGVADDHPNFGLSCDKRAETCAARFGNLINFRGFPTIPGDDFLLITAGQGEPNDGGARHG